MPTAKLTYRVAPPGAFVATTLDIVVIATNPHTSLADIKFAKADEIRIAFPDNMVANQNFSASTPEGSGYSAGRTSGNYFSVKAPFDLILKPGDAMTITFSQVPMASDADPAVNIGITETIAKTSVPVSLPFELKSAGLGIIAWLDKLIVGQSQPAKLTWQSSGGTRVVVSGFPTGTGEKTFDVTGKPPYEDSTTVYVPVQPSKPQQWHYTVTVYTSLNAQEQVTVTLQQNPPIINSFDPEPAATTIRADAPAVLKWHVQFASSVILTTPTIPNWRQPLLATSYAANPGADLKKAYFLNFSQLPKSADYILTVNGFDQPAVQTVSFNIEPVSLLYFKFTAKGGSTAVYETDPNGWSALFQTAAENVLTFTIYQPGGTANVYYLGSGDKTHPQIQFFDFTKKGNKFQLEWVCANLKTLVLNPGDIPIAEGQIPNGTLEVDAPGTYTLTGTTANGQKVNSVLVVSA